MQECAGELRSNLLLHVIADVDSTIELCCQADFVVLCADAKERHTITAAIQADREREREREGEILYSVTSIRTSRAQCCSCLSLGHLYTCGTLKWCMSSVKAMAWLCTSDDKKCLQPLATWFLSCLHLQKGCFALVVLCFEAILLDESAKQRFVNAFKAGLTSGSAARSSSATFWQHRTCGDTNQWILLGRGRFASSKFFKYVHYSIHYFIIFIHSPTIFGSAAWRHCPTRPSRLTACNAQWSIGVFGMWDCLTKCLLDVLMIQSGSYRTPGMFSTSMLQQHAICFSVTQ